MLGIVELCKLFVSKIFIFFYNPFIIIIIISLVIPGGAGWKGTADNSDNHSPSLAALCDSVKDRPVHFQILSSASFFCLPLHIPLGTLLRKDSFCQAWSCHLSIPHHFSFLHNLKQAVMWSKGCNSPSFFNLFICNVVSVRDVQDLTVAFQCISGGLQWV